MRVYINEYNQLEKIITSIKVAIVVLLEPPGSFKVEIASKIRLSNLQRGR